MFEISQETYSFKASFPTGGWENVMHFTCTASFSFNEDEAAITLKIARVANAATYNDKQKGRH